MRLALDTNILAYAEGVNGAARREATHDLIRRLPVSTVVVPVQVLGELFTVLVRKAGRSPASARKAILGWHDTFQIVDTNSSVMLMAFDLAADHKLALWDSVIVGASASAGCRLLLSEDMQDGFTWNGITIANPFAPTRHELLEAVLTPQSPSR